jgi:hypothetical protein
MSESLALNGRMDRHGAQMRTVRVHLSAATPTACDSSRATIIVTAKVVDAVVGR